MTLVATLAVMILGAGAPRAARAQCSTDADCRAYASNCGSCGCVALMAGDPDPFCKVDLVGCFPSACSGKTAVCNVATGQCEIACRADKVCGRECCPLGAECISGACLLPDIYPDANRANPMTNTMTFQGTSCALTPGEGPCIGAAGKRRLLRFDTDTPNIGAGDLFLGDPALYPELYEYSACHNHFHFKSYAKYELFDSRNERLVADGGKRAFCLEDIRRINGPSSARFDCGYQGIQAGWADVYGSGLTCQWIDVTCVPPGTYNIVISLNWQGLLGESDYSNNRAVIPYTIAAPGCTADADCRTFENTCGGMCECTTVMSQCTARGALCSSKIKSCSHPCLGRTAYCNNGRCAIQ